MNHFSGALIYKIWTDIVLPLMFTRRLGHGCSRFTIRGRDRSVNIFEYTLTRFFLPSLSVRSCLANINKTHLNTCILDTTIDHQHLHLWNHRGPPTPCQSIRASSWRWFLNWSWEFIQSSLTQRAPSSPIEARLWQVKKSLPACSRHHYHQIARQTRSLADHRQSLFTSLLNQVSTCLTPLLFVL